MDQVRKLLSLTIPGTNGQPVEIKPPNSDIPTGSFTSGEANGFLRDGIITAMVLGSLLALGFLIWGGISWITSGGDKTKIQAARNKLLYAIVGLVIIFLSVFIISIVGNIFGLNFFNPK
jgi:hypothetical protein